MAGPVVLVSYEDAPARIAHRLRWINENAVPPGLHLWPDPEPLWVAASDRGGESHAGNQWDALWREIRAIGARLVEVDPVSAALTDVSTTETGPVHAFLRALTREAAPDEAAGWQGCGVLLVAHDTKAARNALARGEDPDAGMVAGSAAWYGRTGWGARLDSRAHRHRRRLSGAGTGRTSGSLPPGDRKAPTEAQQGRHERRQQSDRRRWRYAGLVLMMTPTEQMYCELAPRPRVGSAAGAPNVAPPPRCCRAARLRSPTACRWPGGTPFASPRAERASSPPHHQTLAVVYRLRTSRFRRSAPSATIGNHRQRSPLRTASPPSIMAVTPCILLPASSLSRACRGAFCGCA